MKIGVLALQGDFREHIATAVACGYDASEVRTPQQLAQIDALILPGGESTTIVKLADSFGLLSPIRTAISQGLPVYGSCAGMILLANHIVGGVADQQTFGGIDMTVRRNAFGRQVESFESEVEFKGAKLRTVFIRAPWVEDTGPTVEILAQVADHPVAVRQGNLLATSFHPELTENRAVHSYFFEEICKAR